MGINLSLPRAVELKPRIVVIGVGGAGGNAVNNMITSGLDGVEFIVANTDAQALAFSKADCRVQMGAAITHGLGAGMRPEVGEKSAEDSLAEILEHLDGTHMLFIAAGMGGGTGTGAAPVIARAARERGILTVAIITKPFQFEGSRRMAIAEEGIECLESCVDTLITIPNQNLFRIATEQTTMADAFAMADEVLYSGVRGITDLMVVPGLINLDFNDVRTVMDEMGKAMMGTGEATGERRAIEAAESAISNPLLDDVSLKGARGVLINITGGKDLTLYEVEEAASLIRGQVDEEANIIIGSALDAELDGIIRVSVVATGVGSVAGYEQLGEVYTEFSQAEEHEIDDDEEILEDNSVVEQEWPEETPIAATARQSDTRQAPLRAVQAQTHAQPEVQPAVEVQPIRAAAKLTVPPMPTATDTLPSEPANRPVLPASQPRQSTPARTKSLAAEAQTIVKRPFGFFNRKKTAPAGQPRNPVKSTARTLPTGDLFGEGAEDELEIPSFLRRQNR